MATGDSGDMQTRLIRLVPGGWFDDAAPLRSIVFGGIADALAWIYVQAGIVTLMSRLSTATGYFLDIAALDFFGLRIRRNSGQTDTAFRSRIQAEIFRERVTRAGMIKALTDLTGNAPAVFEPWNSQDAGAIGATFACGAGLGIGSVSYPNQVFLTVYRPKNAGIANVAGIATSAGGIGSGAFTGVDLTQETGVTDADIYRTITDTKPSGTIVWAKLI